MEYEGVGRLARFGLVAEMSRALTLWGLGSWRPDAPVKPVARSWSRNERLVVLDLRRDAWTRMSKASVGGCSRWPHRRCLVNFGPGRIVASRIVNCVRSCSMPS